MSQLPLTPPRYYRIRVRGDWSRASFTRARGLRLESVDNGGSSPVTVFSGAFPDEADLQRTLDALFELAVEVVGVRPVQDGSALDRD